MAFDATKLRKAFLVEPLNGDDLPQKAAIESCPSPFSAKAADWSDELREVYEQDDVLKERFKPGLKLTMPDGSEWYIEDDVLPEVVAAAIEAREFLAAQEA